MDKVFFCFGMGFVGQTLGALLLKKGWQVSGTAREEAGCARLRALGFDAFMFDGQKPGEGLDEALSQSGYVLNSIPPGKTDPVLHHYGAALANLAGLRWLGLLSTVGVYGEHHGGWVDENTPPAPLAKRSQERLAAERGWQKWGEVSGIAPHIFRLPGIYGKGRNQLEAVKRGRARRLVKKGQVFNRAHVEDIAQTLYASMQKPDAGHLFNISDDEPAPPQNVVSYACELLGVAPPPEVAFETADLSPMARSFYGECKRVRNDLIKQRLGVKLKYPTYREGLRGLVGDKEEF